jgi:hypothetical protein
MRLQNKKIKSKTHAKDDEIVRIRREVTRSLSINFLGYSAYRGYGICCETFDFSKFAILELLRKPT